MYKNSIQRFVNCSNIEVEKANYQDILNYLSLLTISCNGNYAAISYRGNIGSKTPKVYVYDFNNRCGLGWYISGFSVIEKVVISMNGKYIASIGVLEDKKYLKIIGLENGEETEIVVLPDYDDMKFSNLIENQIFIKKDNEIRDYNINSL